MSNQELIDILAAMRDKSVLVVGDIMLDRFVYGSVDRISPESPVPVLSVTREECMLGGAGNALANLAGLHVQSKILAVIGEDEEGQNIRAQAEALGTDVSGLLVEASRPTIVKTRYLAGHQQLLRTDFEKREEISDAFAAKILEAAKNLIPDVQAVLISDYGKGFLRKDVLAELIELARAQNVPVIVDPKGQDFSIYKGATAVTPNKKELSEATKGMAVSSDEEVIEAAQVIIQECGIESVVATRSKDGMSVIQKAQPAVHFQSEDIEVFDVSGAGDTVIAMIAAALATGADLAQAAELANAAGLIVVTKVGTAPIRAKELEEYFSEQKTRQAEVLDWSEAAEQARRWKARGLKVGFTNGCFDILHFGHVSYLNEARKKCDRLIIALNKDSSVHILKGEDRPVHDQNSRAAVLGALSTVDMVVFFGADQEGEDNTAIDLLKEIQPDIYFKGGDYTIDQIPEAPTVQNYGGEVCVMPVYEGHSTTDSIRKMKDEAA